MMILALITSDSLNVTLEGWLPYGSVEMANSSVMIDDSRDLMFAGHGGVVSVFSLSSTYPSKISDIRTKGIVRSLRASGDRLYVALGSFGYEVWDISNPYAPTRVVSGNPPCGYTRDVKPTPKAFLVATSCATYIYDTSTAYLGTINAQSQEILPYGDTVVLIGDSIVSLDLTDLYSPVIVGVAPKPNRVEVFDRGNSYLYALNEYDYLYTYGLPDLNLIDSSYVGSFPGHYVDMLVMDSTVITLRSYYATLLDFYTMTSPTTVVWDSTDTLSNDSLGARVMNYRSGYLYIAGLIENKNALFIFRNSVINVVPLMMFRGRPAVYHEYAYLHSNTGLCIVSVSSPSSPEIVECTSDKGYPLVAYRGDGDSILITVSYGEDSIRFYDLSVPYSPALISSTHANLSCPSMEFSPENSCPHYDTKDSLLFLHSYTVDLSLPTPSIIGSYSAWDLIEVDGNVLFTPGEIYDITDPTSPNFIANMPCCVDFVKPVDMEKVDTILIVSYENFDDVYYNVADVYNPSLTDSISIQAGVFMELRNDTLFGQSISGIHMYDRTLSTNLGFYRFPVNMWPYGLQPYGDRVFTLYKQKGLNIFKILVPLDVEVGHTTKEEGRCIKYYDVSGRLVEGDKTGIVFCYDGVRYRKILRR